MQGVCVFKKDDGMIIGIARLKQESINHAVRIKIEAWGLTPGLHGFHIHQTGNTVDGAHTLCAHFDPTGNTTHGDLNDHRSHAGDLGNLSADRNGKVKAIIYAKYVTLIGDVRDSIFGRSLIIHADPDDLGLGGHPDSKINGHSGERFAYGIIGVDSEKRCH